MVTSWKILNGERKFDISFLLKIALRSDIYPKTEGFTTYVSGET